VLLLVVACSYGTLPPRIVEGREFSVVKAKTIEEGMTSVQVKDALGEPFEVKKRGSKEYWRYYARERKDGVTYVLGFIPKGTPHFIQDYELKLTLGNGQVEEANYQEAKIR
jgi:outer membrane protein assembly factor BamE (lipoprotein component of BamABCDE complex)